MAATILKRNRYGYNEIWYNRNDKPKETDYITSSQYLIDLGKWERERVHISFNSVNDENLIIDHVIKQLGYYPLNYQVSNAVNKILLDGIEIDCVKVDKDLKSNTYNRLVAYYNYKINKEIKPERFDDIFKKYRQHTNNEDAYSFKEWLKENYEYVLPKKTTN
jgi:hypothetical protein